MYVCKKCSVQKPGLKLNKGLNRSSGHYQRNDETYLVLQLKDGAFKKSYEVTFSVNPPLFIAFPQLVDNVQPAKLIGVSLEKPPKKLRTVQAICTYHSIPSYVQQLILTTLAKDSRSCSAESFFRL